MQISELVRGEVVGRDQLLMLGFNSTEVRMALHRGELIPLGRGVYQLAATSGSGSSVDRLRISGVARRSPAMVISHVSAALMHVLPIWGVDQSIVHLTRAPGGGSVRRPGRIVHSAAIDSADVVDFDGLNVTSVARTLVDLGRSVPFESAVIACDFALHEHLIRPAELLLALEAARGHPGSRDAYRALMFADGRSESVGESRTRVLFHRFGLTPPELQVEVFDRFGHRVGRTDFGYPEDAALIEFDGFVKYEGLLKPGQSASQVVVAEKRRESEVRDVGSSVLRIVWGELQTPGVVIDGVERVRYEGRQLRKAGITTGSFRPLKSIRISE